MVSIKTDLPSYFDVCLILIGVAFWILLIHSSLKILFNCLTYGRQRGIVNVLTPIYLITLLCNASMILLIILHEIEIHSPFYRDDNIENIVRIIGSYCILWLNFMIDCLILSCWLPLFGDLFNYLQCKSFIVKHGINKFIYALFIFSAIYLIIIIVVSILIEISNITILNLQILSYIHLAPIMMNIIVSLLCICKLPIAQPLDLSIGLYQRNTLCSCYTRVTRYVWSISIIAIAQIFYLVLYILEIDIWNIDENKDDKWMDIISNNHGLLIYFVSQFIVLIWLWGFLYTSIKRSFQFYTELDVIKQAMPPPISEGNNKENGDIQQLQKIEENEPIKVPQNSGDYNNSSTLEQQENVNETIHHQKQLTEEQMITLKIAEDRGNYDAFDPNNYQSVETGKNSDDTEDMEDEEDDIGNLTDPNNVDVEMQDINKQNIPQKPTVADSMYSGVTRIKDDDAKMDIAESEHNMPSYIPPTQIPIIQATPSGDGNHIQNNNDNGENQHDENQYVPPAPIPHTISNHDDNTMDTPNDNDNDNALIMTATHNDADKNMSVMTTIEHNDDSGDDDEEEESSEAEGTEVRHYTDDEESTDDDDDDDEGSNPNIIVKF